MSINHDSKNTYKSYSGHGVDVAINRADDLDRLSLNHFTEKNSPSVLDLGCGAGGHTFRIAGVGVQVTAIDVNDFSNEFLEKENELIHFICGDINNLEALTEGNKFTDAYTQRTLHYISYESAYELLKILNKIVDDRLYISVMGIESEASEGYLGNGVGIETRFYKLHTESMNKYSIHAPVCLYSKEEFITLLENSGWKIKRCWQSAFGNIKAICIH